MTFLKMLVICSLAFFASGCAPPMAIKGEEMPREGNYAVLLRDTGESTLVHVGTTVFTNAIHRVPSHTRAAEKLKADVIDTMAALPRYQQVEVDAHLGRMVLPRFYVNSYDGSFGMFSTDEYEADQAAVSEQLKQLAAENNLRFILLISEWGTSDEASGTNQPLVGNGVQFRSLFGSESVTAFSVFRLRLYDAVTAKSNFWSKAFLRSLPDSSWIELSEENAPPENEYGPLLQEIDSTVTPGASNELLCVVGLLPPPAMERAGNAFSACRKAFGSD